MSSLANRTLLTGLLVASLAGGAQANAFREKGKPATVAGSAITVTPTRDWNQLSLKLGKKAETWTLDGEQLNDVTFYGGIAPGEPLVKERNKKREPLPRFTGQTLLAEVPELLAGTYRAYKQIGAFQLAAAAPDSFMGQRGIRFRYEYTDDDGLPRNGDARAAIVAGKLYMMTFDAPRLYYFTRTLDDFAALAGTAKLN